MSEPSETPGDKTDLPTKDRICKGNYAVLNVTCHEISYNVLVFRDWISFN